MQRAANTTREARPVEEDARPIGKRSEPSIVTEDPTLPGLADKLEPLGIDDGCECRDQHRFLFIDEFHSNRTAALLQLFGGPVEDALTAFSPDALPPRPEKAEVDSPAGPVDRVDEIFETFGRHDHSPSLSPVRFRAVRLIETESHPIKADDYRLACRDTLRRQGVLVLAGFFSAEMIERSLADAARREPSAFFANSTHNVWLTEPDPTQPEGHSYNRQVISSKGLIADDQLSADSPLREVYGDVDFRAFLCAVLEIDEIHPYADELSSINVHYAPEGRELGWHFDNSSFAVTMLLQAPVAGGQFEYVPNVRTDLAVHDRIDAILDGSEPVEALAFAPGDLVLFRGHDALHRVTPTEGATTRMLVVFAYNDQPGVGLSQSALQTFYGRFD